MCDPFVLFWRKPTQHTLPPTTLMRVHMKNVISTHHLTGPQYPRKHHPSDIITRPEKTPIVPIPGSRIEPTKHAYVASRGVWVTMHSRVHSTYIHISIRKP